MSVTEQLRRRQRRFQDLDFLRGVAAIVVVMFHFSSRVNLEGLFHHGYLAVDFFFILSGFVIGRAYGDQLSSGVLSFKRFFLIRLIRVLPLVISGTLLAAVIDIFRPGNFLLSHHLFDIVYTFVMGCLCLPIFWSTTLEQTTFPLNGPVWSLSFELFANFFCVPIFRTKNSSFWFLALTFCSMSVMILTSVTTLAQSESYNFGTHQDTFLLGIPRVLWSYPLGILISRLELKLPSVGKWFCAAVLFYVLLCPELPQRLDLLYCASAKFLLFPILISSAVSVSEVDCQSKLSEWSGNMSYPLYAIHYPLVRVISTILRELHLSPILNLLITMISTILIALSAFFFYKVLDIPIRRGLSQKIGRLYQPRV